VLLTLEKYPDGRPSLVRAGVGNIAVFGMSGSVHDRRPRNAPAGVICTRVPWSSHTIVVDDLRDASTAALTVSTHDASPAALPVGTPSQIRGGHWFCTLCCCTTGNLLASVVAEIMLSLMRPYHSGSGTSCLSSRPGVARSRAALRTCSIAVRTKPCAAVLAGVVIDCSVFHALLLLNNIAAIVPEVCCGECCCATDCTAAAVPEGRCCVAFHALAACTRGGGGGKDARASPWPNPGGNGSLPSPGGYGSNGLASIGRTRPRTTSLRPNPGGNGSLPFPDGHGSNGLASIGKGGVDRTGIRYHMLENGSSR
jgi:hypothetical protein